MKLRQFALKWLAISLPLGAVVGSACALFLWSLDQVTRFRWEHPELLFALPVAGAIMGLAYHFIGKGSEGGNDLIIDEIHEPAAGVPRRMAPMILIGTLITHLFGGSAGREGTAVQMGGSMASAFSHILRISTHDRRLLLMAGMAAGFAGVFGTPLAGCVFALEVLAIGQMKYEAVIPCIIAALTSDVVCSAWGIQHTDDHLAALVSGSLPAEGSFFQGPLFLKIILASIIFGLVSRLFSELAHRVHASLRKIIPWPFLRPVVGGALVIGMVYALGTRDYLGLGVSSPAPDAVTILSGFKTGGADLFSWLWKLLFTVVTTASGFKGGEVTPLFFIGSSLGNVLSRWMGTPVELFASLGFVAVFAGASNTPLACTIMAMELFDPHHAVYYATACFIAYLISGYSGIYNSQRIGARKLREKH